MRCSAQVLQLRRKGPGCSPGPVPQGKEKPPLWRRGAEHIRGDSRAKKSPPCAKGGQHGRAMQGGLQSQANDSARCCDRVMEHGLAVPTPGPGSTAWLRMLAVNPSVCVRRQLPLHKGESGGRTAILSFAPAPERPDFLPGLRTIAQRGSAVWVQRHAAIPLFAQANTTGKGKDRNGCSVTLPEALRQVQKRLPEGSLFLGLSSIAQRGSAVWDQRHAGQEMFSKYSLPLGPTSTPCSPFL